MGSDGPTLYTNNNRTPVTGDVTAIATYLIFITLFLAFLIIFPGVRKERFTTFLTVTLSLFVGNVIMVARCGSGWHVGKIDIESSYRAFSKELISAQLGAYIGLGHVNITLKAIPSDNSSEDIDFNERFSWSGSHEMGQSYREAIQRGLPFPILTVAEYFSLGQEGFTWGGQYRAAGYYSAILLWAAFASWLLMNLLLVVVPRYGAYMMTLTGSFLLTAAFVYHCLLPANPLLVHFEQNKILSFRFGWCFWLVIIAGAFCSIIGLIISIGDWLFPNRFSTILEVDYDTPYDRHIIIEDSNHRKKGGKAGLEEPPGLGRRILRRLSSKKDEESEQTKLRGLDNRGFEMDPPKSPWRYPFNRPAIAGTAFKRSISQDSNSSISSVAVPHVTFARRTSEHPAVARTDPPSSSSVPGRSSLRNKSTREVSMW